MLNRSGMRPSAGAVIGVLALVLAIGGTALAGPHTAAKLTRGKVKAIAAQQVKDLASGLSVKNAETADRANTAAIATNVLSANVNSDGNLASSVPSGATSTRIALGNYTVSFGRSLTDCTISAAAATTGGGGPDLGFVAVALSNSTTLQVFTRSPTNVVADRPFSVQAICPV